MASSKLIFPVGFDFSGAVSEREIKATLDRVERIVKGQPVMLTTTVDTTGLTHFTKNYTQSIDEIKNRISQLNEMWSQIKPNEMFNASGKGFNDVMRKFSYTESINPDGTKNIATETSSVEKLYAEYAQLVELLQRFAKSLSQVHAERIRNINETIQQVERDAVSVKNQVNAVTALKDRILQLQDAQNKVGTHQNQIDNLTKKLQDQEIIVGLLRSNWENARNARIAYESAGTTKNADNTANKDYIAALETEKQLAQQLTSEEQKLLNVQTQRLQMLRQIGLSGNIDTISWGAHDAGAINAQIAEYERLKKLIRDLGVEYERLKAIHNQAGTDITQDANANRILKERIQATKDLEKVTQTADQAQNKLLREQEALTAKINARQQAKAQKAAEEQRQIQQRIAALKQERAALVLKENSIDNISRKLAATRSQMSKLDFNKNPEGFKRMADEVDRLTKKLEKLTETEKQRERRLKQEAKDTVSAYKQQTDYLTRLTERMAMYASVSYIITFLNRVREVTAEFEKQRVALGAIIQDQVKGNALFSQIKAFALKSPISILQLTRYTKQVAAYRIETDKLFDTTKRLADVSVGLGVDMQRIVLAYGQVRAATYLRAAEVRQFTEAGIPMLELLAEKFTKLEGRMVTTGEVMERIKKRGVEFKDVEEIFNDMTSAGGIFADMQEKMGNTLFGLWAKLSDAASIMYDEIGNSSAVNSGMKKLINMLMDVMHHWRSWAKSIASTGGAALAFMAVLYTVTAAQKAHTMIVKQSTYAHLREREALISKSLTLRLVSGFFQMCGMNAKRATAYTLAFSKALNFIGTVGIMAVVTALTILVEKLFQAHDDANRLKNALADIDKETGVEQMKSVRNFESLANMAVNAVDGSMTQKKALDELQRTYKDIIPLERLTIDNLRAMKGIYDELTQSIKDYVQEQMNQKKVNTIVEETGRTMVDNTKKFRDNMAHIWNYEQITRYMEEFEKLRRQNKEASYKEIRDKAISNIGVDPTLMHGFEAIGTASQSLKKFDEALKEQIELVDALQKAWTEGYEALGKYGDGYKELVDKAREKTVTIGGKVVDEENDSFLYNQQKANMEIAQAMIPQLKKIMSDAGVVWQDGWANIINEVDAAAPKIISSIDFNAIYQYLRENMDALTDEQRKAVQALEKIYTDGFKITEVQRHYRGVAIDIAKSMEEPLRKIGNGMRSATTNVSRYFIKAGQSVNGYAKGLDDAIKELTASIAELEFIGQALSPESRKELEDLKTMLEYVTALRKAIASAVTEENKNKGRQGKSKETIGKEKMQEWNEYSGVIEKVYNRYRELQKTMSDTAAHAHISEYYKESLDFLQKTGLKIKEFPKTTEEYKNMLRQVRDELEKTAKQYNLVNEWAAKKHIAEINVKLGEIDFKEAQEQLEKMLKDLSKQISDSKAAREFFKSIFDQAQNYDLAMSLTMSVYGEDGANYAQLIQDQIKTLFGAGDDSRITIDVEPAIDMETGTVDYNKLEEIFEANKHLIGSEYWSAIQKMIDDGRKFNVEQAKLWIKDLANARSWAEKRVDLATYTREQIKEIQESNLNQDLKDQLISGYKHRENKEGDKLLFEAFKNTPMYVALFNNLESASTGALTAMREKLIQVRGEMSNLDPTQLKEIQKRLTEIDSQLSERNINPFKQLKELFSQFDKSVKGSWAERLSTGAQDLGLGDISTYQELDELLSNLTTQQINKQAELNKLLDDGVSEDDERVKILVQELNTLEKQTNFLSKMSDEYTDIQKHQKEVWKGADKVKDGIMEVADSAYEMAEAFGASDDVLALFKDIQNSINLMYQLTQNVTSAVWAMSKTTADGISTVEKASIILTVISTALQVATALFNLFANANARKLENQIKKEQKLIDALSYSYERLKNVSESVFGSDYINNYNQRLKQLQQMQESYQKQAELERQKGKKKDEEKIKEYENAARDTADKILEMQREVVNRMTGTDIASAARDFASAWLDAYISFESTTSAIKDKFNDMIKNMVIESAMARIVETVLDPLFKEIDEMAKSDNNLSVDEISEIASKIPYYTDTISNGLQIFADQLESVGLDLHELGESGEFKGIARDIASASEESINGLAAMINTQNYYISNVPLILQEVMLIRTLLSGGNVSLTTGETMSTTDLLTLQNEYLIHLPTISSNTTLIAERCERAMIACEDIADKLSNVIKPRGAADAGGWVVVTNI